MGVFVTIAIIAFVPICIVLTLIILLQDSKGEGLSSSAFGGSEIQSVLGGHGAASFLSKLTTWVAVGFMVISLFLMKFYGESGTDTLTPNEEAQQQQDAADTGDTVDIETDDENPKGNIEVKQDENEQPTEDSTAEDTKGTLEDATDDE